MDRPVEINSKDFRFDSFTNGEVLHNKKKNHLPAMGWNSWNAFGSGNTEALTKAMADKIVELELDKLGYSYIVLDDGCYKSERIDGFLANEEIKFPSGFKALAAYIHDKGLKFGMYNDIGTNLCAGAAVGTCGHEMIDAKTYLGWDVDFIKVDNCYYLWDNATFSNAENAKYTYAPNIKGISITGNGIAINKFSKDGTIKGKGAFLSGEYVTNIGTFDGTGPDNTPVGDMSSELVFEVDVNESGSYELTVEYATSREAGTGTWLTLAVNDEIIYDNELPESSDKETFVVSEPFSVGLNKGNNVIRLMNHRRQENTLNSYAALVEGFNRENPDNDVILSICEWGKTQPQNWGYKVGDSWRILNDITFQVGADGNPGHGAWESDYTTSVMAQYNKAVIMDEFAGLNKGWNDPDMMMIGMDGLDETMCRTHMTMWCMMNSPLMLGLDLRRVKKNDRIYNIISNKDLIDVNQDPLGIQAKRIYSSLSKERPDEEYIRDNNRVDVLAKPMADGSVILSFINGSQEEKTEKINVDAATICKYLGGKMVNCQAFLDAREYKIVNLWTKETTVSSEKIFGVDRIAATDNVTVKVIPQ